MSKRERQSPVVVTCDTCGKGFTKHACHVKRSKHHFCSKICAYESKSPYHRQCSHCGKMVRGSPGRWKNKENAFCDSACYGAWQKKAPRQGEYVTLICSNCGNVFERAKCFAGNYKHNFCNRECKGAWWSEAHSGANHPRWLGEDGKPKYYGPNWRRQRRAARKRDGYECQDCGSTEEELGRELDAHHIAPFRLFGYIRNGNENYKQANRLDNLASLCKRCHKIAEWATDLAMEEAS